MLSNDNKEANEKSAPVLVSLFQVIATAQNEHGIPNQDFEQYHKYCTNRLTRIRHHSSLRSLLVHSSKYAGSSSDNAKGDKKKKHAFSSNQWSRLDNISDQTLNSVQQEYLLYYNLFQAERAWATSQHQKQSKRSKLRKAVQWAEKLVQFAEKTTAQNGTTTIPQEANLYASWMKGNSALEEQRYEAAYSHYQFCYSGLHELVQKVDGDIELQDSLMNRAEQLVLPLLRFCQYEANIAGDTNMTAQVSTNSLKPTAKIVVHFRNQEIPLDHHYKELAVLYLKVEKSLQQTSNKSEKDMLQLLNDIQDAIALVHKEKQKYASDQAGIFRKAKVQELQTLESFFVFSKMKVSFQQQEFHLKELSDVSSNENLLTRLRLYDQMQRQLEQMIQVVQDDDDEGEEIHFIQAHLVRIRALRCYYLAAFYEEDLDRSNSSGASFTQIIHLVRQSVRMSKRAVEELSAVDDENEQSSVYLDELERVELLSRALRCRMETKEYLCKTHGQWVRFGNTNRPLLERLEDMDAGTTLVNGELLPMIAVPPTPVFVDLAFPGRDATDFLASIEELIQDKTPKKKSFFGLFY